MDSILWNDILFWIPDPMSMMEFSRSSNKDIKEHRQEMIAFGTRES